MGFYISKKKIKLGSVFSLTKLEFKKLYLLYKDDYKNKKKLSFFANNIFLVLYLCRFFLFIFLTYYESVVLAYLLYYHTFLLIDVD